MTTTSTRGPLLRTPRLPELLPRALRRRQRGKRVPSGLRARRHLWRRRRGLLQGGTPASKSGFEGSAQDGTSLADWLRARHISDLDVVGIATDHCVKATALDGVRAGFAVQVLLDYTAGVAADTTSTAISELRQAGVALSGEPVVLA